MVFSNIETWIAWRYLRSRRKEGFISIISFFSLIGIALGVATLIVITSVMNGVRHEMLEHFIGWNGHVNVYGQAGPIADYDSLKEQLMQIDGVTMVIPKIEGQVMVSSKGRAIGAQATAFPTKEIEKKTHILENIEQGSIEAFLDGEGVVIGQRMADNLGVRVGDSITLISPEGRATIAGLVPRLKAYPVVATFNFGLHSFDAGLVLMPFEEAQIYFKLKKGDQTAVTGLEIYTDNYDMAAIAAQDIYQSLNGAYRVYNWQQSHESIFNALRVQRNVMFVILTLIIIVAAFNIISSLIMLVSDKQKGVAILRTMGASKGSVLRIFFIAGSLIGIMGTAIGVGMGLLVAYNTENIRVWIENISGQKLLAEQLYFLSTIPSDVNATDVIAVMLMSLALSFLSTLYPAYRAASIDPAKVVRYE